MIYSSLLFIYGFLPLSLLIYWLTPEKMKNTSLLLSSIVFCALNSLRFLKFMVIYTLINYFSGLFIGKFRNKKIISAVPLFIGVSADLIIFFMFRTDFLDIFKDKLKIPDVFFPVGVSFITLTAIGYLVDIYRKCIRAEFDIIKFSLYMMMFPAIIIRPVIRYNTFRRMLNDQKITMFDVGTGFKIFVKGLAEKVIAGDTMYMLYMAVRSVDIWKMSAVNAWLGMTAYMLSIYFTLSGMADMGKGIGYCFGFRFPNSFNYPIFSNKMQDFSSNWHIQIIYWFRRYVAKPLYDICRSRIYRKIIFITAWCCVGIWYRFDVNGIIWGGIIGLSVVIEKYMRRFRVLKITGIIYTYVITIICMVFFSGENIIYSTNYLLVLLGGNKIFADSMTLYLLKYYIVLLLICTYCSTGLFRNMVMRSGKNYIRTVIAVVSPVITILMLAVCTALISYTGSSELSLIRL
ncbi:MAG: hypothetical protein NC205_07145 [Prevotella sp.]|nr:hypothetical protein [Alistipes senegalensis]MCM1358354.1 hypothetical protein [Prevotella sp.]MCM1474351.1 hypothetical protein [Muribaculaceae bacterium]